MNKVALYIRVSTQEQAEEGYSIGAQTERLKAYCMSRDWIVYDTYVDPGYSGSNIDRPALKKLISDAKNKKIDTVLVYKLDRLSRSQKDTLLLIEDVFNKHDVSFVSINENFDTSTAFGRAMVGILSVFAQLEREQIRERTMMGRLERAKDGYFHGGGFDPIGYDYIDGHLVINEYEAMQVRKVFELFVDKHWPLTRIQTYMHEHYTNKHGSWYSHSSVVSTITLPLYCGKIKYNDDLFEGRHESIITEDMFNKAQARYESVRWNKNDSKHKHRPFQAKHLLTGLLYCGNCGARYFGKGNYSGRGENKRYRPYYTCYSRGKTAARMVMDPDCKNKSFATVDLDKTIIDQILKLAYEPGEIGRIIDNAKPKETNNDNAIIENRIDEIDKQLSRLIDLYQLGSIEKDDLTSRVERLNNEKSSLTEELLSTIEEPKLSIVEVEHILEHAEVTLGGNDLKEKRALVHALISKIVIDNENIIIHWAFV